MKVNQIELENLNVKNAIELFQKSNLLEKKLKKSLKDFEISLKVKPFLKATLYLNDKK